MLERTIKFIYFPRTNALVNGIVNVDMGLHKTKQVSL